MSSIDGSGPHRSAQTLALNIDTSSDPTMQNGLAFFSTRSCGTGDLTFV
jgi:hypothetical protein